MKLSTALRRLLPPLLLFGAPVECSHWDPREGYRSSYEASWDTFAEIPVALCLAMVLTSLADTESMWRNAPYWRPYVDCYTFAIDDRLASATEVHQKVLRTHAVVDPQFLHVFYLQHGKLEGPGHARTVLMRETALRFPEATHIAVAEPGWRAVAETFNRLQLHVITAGPAPPRGWPTLLPGESPPDNEMCKVFAFKLSEGEGDDAAWQWADRILSLNCSTVLRMRDASSAADAALNMSWALNVDAGAGKAAATAGMAAAGEVATSEAAGGTLVGYRMLPWEVHLESAPTMGLFAGEDLLGGKAATGRRRKLQVETYRLAPAVGDASAAAAVATPLSSGLADFLATKRAEAEAMARGDAPFSCAPYHFFSIAFLGPISPFAGAPPAEQAVLLRDLQVSTGQSPDPDWRAIARYNLGAALTALNRTTEAFAVYAAVFRTRGSAWPVPRPLRPATVPLAIVTVSSDAGDGLRNLVASIKAARVPCRFKVLGLGTSYDYHGLKISLYGDYLRSLDPAQLVLGLDAYDTLVFPAVQELPTRYAAMGAPIVVCGERGSWPDTAVAPFYPHPHYYTQPPGAGTFPLLNSGVFIGRAGDLSAMFDTARAEGAVAVCGDDQRAFIRRYVADPVAMRIDAEAELFLSVHGAQRLSYWRDEHGGFFARAGEDAPVVAPAVLHFNANDGKNAYPAVVAWWREAVTAAGDARLLEVTDEDLRQASGQ